MEKANYNKNVNKLLKLTKALDKLCKESDMPYVMAVKLDDSGRVLRARYGKDEAEQLMLIAIWIARMCISSGKDVDALLFGVCEAVKEEVFAADWQRRMHGEEMKQ